MGICPSGVPGQINKDIHISPGNNMKRAFEADTTDKQRYWLFTGDFIIYHTIQWEKCYFPEDYMVHTDRFVCVCEREMFNILVICHFQIKFLFKCKKCLQDKSGCNLWALRAVWDSQSWENPPPPPRYNRNGEGRRAGPSHFLIYHVFAMFVRRAPVLVPPVGWGFAGWIKLLWEVVQRGSCGD